MNISEKEMLNITKRLKKDIEEMYDSEIASKIDIDELIKTKVKNDAEIAEKIAEEIKPHYDKFKNTIGVITLSNGENPWRALISILLGSCQFEISNILEEEIDCGLDTEQLKTIYRKLDGIMD